MNLWLRLLAVALRAASGPPLPPLGTSTLPFRVRPGDLDLNGHVNNGRYLTLMDLGRLDLTVRTGLWRPMLRLRWAPVVAAVIVRFRRELKLGQAFSLTTRVLGWDDRWFFLEHRMERDGDVVCTAIIKAAFKDPAGRLAPSQVAVAMGFGDVSPTLSPAVAAWLAAEAELLGGTAAGKP